MPNCHVNLIDVAALLDYITRIKNVSQATHFVQYSPNLTPMFFTPRHTNVIRWILDF